VSFRMMHRMIDTRESRDISTLCAIGLTLVAFPSKMQKNYRRNNADPRSQRQHRSSVSDMPGAVLSGSICVHPKSVRFILMIHTMSEHSANFEDSHPRKRDSSRELSSSRSCFVYIRCAFETKLSDANDELCIFNVEFYDFTISHLR